MYKILLVEDNMGDVLILNEYLKEYKNKYQFVSALSLQAAISRLENEVFDVILLDLNLPDSIGTHTLKEIIHYSKNAPIIVFTIMDDEFFWEELAKAGASDYIVKGQFDGELLIKRITFVINKSQNEINLKQYLFNLDNIKN